MLRCPFHTVRFESTKDDGAKLLLNLSKFAFSCRFISSDTDRAELNEVASLWSKGELDVLISTTIALVGNENPFCRHVAVAGYLFDSMQIVQAIGRLRNYMRSPTGRIYFSVPAMLPMIRIQEDENRLTRLVNEKIISKQSDLQQFRATMTSSGVRDWVMDLAQPSCGSCPLKKLSVSFGKSRQICGVCISCLSNDKLSSTQNEAMIQISKEQKDQQATDLCCNA